MKRTGTQWRIGASFLLSTPIPTFPLQGGRRLGAGFPLQGGRSIAAALPLRGRSSLGAGFPLRGGSSLGAAFAPARGKELVHVPLPFTGEGISDPALSLHLAPDPVPCQSGSDGQNHYDRVLANLHGDQRHVVGQILTAAPGNSLADQCVDTEVQTAACRFLQSRSHSRAT